MYIYVCLCMQYTGQIVQSASVSLRRILPVTVCSSGGSSRLGISVGSVTTLETHTTHNIHKNIGNNSMHLMHTYKMCILNAKDTDTGNI